MPPVYCLEPAAPNTLRARLTLEPACAKIALPLTQACAAGLYLGIRLAGFLHIDETAKAIDHFVASPPSTMIVSTSPAPLRRKVAASLYSGDVKQATPSSKVGNSITTKR